MPDLATLGKRLRRYTQLLEGKPLRVRLVADDHLRYEPAARIIATCSAAGVAAIRLTPPGATPALPGGGERPAGIGNTPPVGRTRNASDETRLLLAGDRDSVSRAPGDRTAGRQCGRRRSRDVAISSRSLIWPAIARRSRVSRPPLRPRRPTRRSAVKFRDLWNRPDVFRGRRVTVEGRVVRIFRQGPVGSFPPLAEVWITSPAGDPFCVVFPQTPS